MATQLETLRLLAPEFAGIPDAEVQKFLDIAPLFIDPLKYSIETRGLALVYQACSLMYQQKQSTSGDSSGLDVTMEKEGDLQRSYGRPGVSNSKGDAKDIYMQQLDMLTLQFAGSCMMTRYGLTVPQGYDVG